MKKNVKVAIAFILGFICSSTVAYAATLIASSEVLYDNSKSKLESTDVQGALDELYTKAESCGNGGGSDDTLVNTPNDNIVNAYVYNESTCRTGEEIGCEKTACYKNKSVGSCEPGTIIQYKVDSNNTKSFNVLHDDGSLITLQGISSVKTYAKWNAGSSSKNTSKPISLYNDLYSSTKDWTNVPLQQNTMGTTIFLGNAYTGCITDSSNNVICNQNSYSGDWNQRARTITVQEATALGCSLVVNSCPTWLRRRSYWTMSADASGTSNAWVIEDNLVSQQINSDYPSILPVILIKKEA